MTSNRWQFVAFVLFGICVFLSLWVWRLEKEQRETIAGIRAMTAKIEQMTADVKSGRLWSEP